MTMLSPIRNSEPGVLRIPACQALAISGFSYLNPPDKVLLGNGTFSRPAAARRQQSAPVLEILKGELVALHQHPKVLDKWKLCRAINYTLA
jgi:hypothetical protein